MTNRLIVSTQHQSPPASVVRRMSRLVTVTVALCLVAALGAQTNTFPASGNVGIGTTSPGYPLSVAGNANVNGILSVGSNANVNFQSDGNNGYYSAAANGLFYFDLGGTYKAVLNGNGLSINNGSTGTASGVGLAVATGNVGIGITNPPYKLQVAPGGAGSGLGVGWNGILPGYGETDFYNYGQGGGGGFVFANYSSPGISYPTTGASVLMTILPGGNVGIGTTSPAHLLHVAGAIGAEEVIVSSTGADYVFQPAYRLRPLSEVHAFIQANHHLPDIPSEAEMREKGIGLGEMQVKLLAKVEELTLHMIEADERNKNLEQQNRELQGRIARLEAGVHNPEGSKR